MKCLIIAAGLGSRLVNKGDSKPLVLLNGTPLIERVILALTAGGVTEIVVVIGYNGDKVRSHLTAFSETHAIPIAFIFNPQWEKPNGISVLCGREKITEPFFLSMSDHLFDPEIINQLRLEGVADGEVKLAVDRRIVDNSLVDLEDVTKVLTDGDCIQNIGKTITPYNAFDTGIFLCSPAIFPALEESIAAGDASLSGGIRQLAQHRKARIFDIGHRVWIDVDDDAAFDRAQAVFG